MSSQDSENHRFEQSHTVLLLAGQPTPQANTAQQSVRLPVAVAENSAYLNARIRLSSTRSATTTITISLPDVEPAALRLYAWWLQLQNAPLFLHDDNGPVAQRGHTLLWRECFDLIQAHLLGTKFGDVDFQRYILTQLDAWLRPQQEPDLELLDHLWEVGRDVSDELLGFVMGRMFRMERQMVGVLVRWMKGLVGGRRMMDYMEGNRGGGGRGEGARSTLTSTGLDSREEETENQTREGVPLTKSSASALAERSVASEPASRDRTPPWLYRRAGEDVQNFSKKAQRDYEDESLAASHQKSQSRKATHMLRPHTFAVPKRKPMHRPSTGWLEHLPQTLTIHPIVRQSIADTAEKEVERRRAESKHLPLALRLHPSLHGVLPSTPPPARHRHLAPAAQYAHPELRGGAHSAAPGRGNGTATMPDASFSLLDFWTDPSPSDILGSDFWADIPTHTPEAANPPTQNPQPQSQLQSRQANLPLSTATKQTMHSFRLTRTPTPRRRATRSWSVASIRGSSHSACAGHRLDRPERGVISRKPVPVGGLEFLSQYFDGERLVRVVSVNSRPERVGLRRGNLDSGRVRGVNGEGEEMWEQWVGRPGTA